MHTGDQGRSRKREGGEVMLEGMIVIVFTVIMLIWILGVGFLYYQRYTVRIVTNDATAKIAATYNAPSTDIIMGYMRAKDLTGRSLYGSRDLTDINQQRIESFIKFRLDQVNFTGVVDDVQVQLKYTKDALGRSHVMVTTTCRFNTPFGSTLAFLGGGEKATYSVTALADSTNVSDYVSATTLADALTNGSVLKGSGFPEKFLKMINSIMKCYDKWSH